MREVRAAARPARPKSDAMRWAWSISIGRPASLAGRSVLAALCAMGALWSVARAARPPDAMPAHILPPRTVDPAIVHADANNLVYLPPSGASDSGLLLFIGGAPGPGASFTPFVSEAVRLGWRVIALDYSYDPPGTQLCEGRPGGDCFERYRTAKVFGGNMPGLSVPPAEAVAGRIDHLLRFLAARFPAEGWDAYRDSVGPRWSSIAVTGFSQGSGLAAYLAKRIAVRRVILLSSPWDHYSPIGQLAGWLRQPSATSADRWWGLYAAGEPDAPWLARAYAALGLAPSHVSALGGVPQRPAPAGASPGVAYHWSVIGRGYTPLLPDGDYAYRQAWDAALTARTSP